MYKKIIFICLFLFIFAPLAVHADCGDCNVNNCKDCGCTLNQRGDACIYENISNGGFASCGDGIIDKIPTVIPKVTSIIYNVIQVAVPILLVIIGSLDMIKAVAAAKEDDIRKNQGLFIKGIIAALLVFFVFVVVKFFISLIADDSSDNIIDCAVCFIENKCG